MFWKVLKQIALHALAEAGKEAVKGAYRLYRRKEQKKLSSKPDLKEPEYGSIFDEETAEDLPS